MHEEITSPCVLYRNLPGYIGANSGVDVQFRVLTGASVLLLAAAFAAARRSTEILRRNRANLLSTCASRTPASQLSSVVVGDS